MIDKGANPFIVAYNGTTWTGETRHLSNLPTPKSIYFLTRPLVDNDITNADFCDPWFYRNGVFDGKFDSAIGQGATGIVSGEWYEKRAAFKFVEIGNQTFQKNMKDGLKALDEKLSEMTSIQATKG